MNTSIGKDGAGASETPGNGPGYYAAVDLGASSGRVVLGRVGPGTLEVREVARFPNGAVRLPDGLHWNLVGLYESTLNGLHAAMREVESLGGLTSVGIDAWAVDYGLLSGQDTRRMSLVGVPFHYRDARTARGVERTHAKMSFEELYRRNGLQFLPFNTLYQLATEERLASSGAGGPKPPQRLLLLPDLLGYWLTGDVLAEESNASTTGLLNVHTRQWDVELMERLDIDPGLFAPVAAPGTLLGELREDLVPLLGGRSSRVVLVGSHDTASAVVGTPLSTPNAAYISCGTWGLVGLELEEPVVTEASRRANFTNEGGVDGRTRFLTNVMGTWLLSETLRLWEQESGESQDLSGLLAAAEQVPENAVCIFDVSDPRFLPPGDMPARIEEVCREQGVAVPASRPALVRSIIESIAVGFASALREAERLSGRAVDIVHMVGGGSLNTLLCQATADRSGLSVLAGPVEATAIGNLLIQARASGVLEGTLEDLRALVMRTQKPLLYRARQ